MEDGVILLHGFSGTFGNDLKTAVEIDNMRYRSDGTAKHFLFQRRCDAHIFHRILQTEAEIQNILHLFTEIVIGHRNRVASALVQNQKQIADVFQRCDLFQKCQGDQMGNLIGEILFFDRICNEPLFYIVSDHGAGHILKSQGTDALVDIFGCLLQIESHIGDLMIPWETKTTNGAGKYVSDVISHRSIIMIGKEYVNGK